MFQIPNEQQLTPSYTRNDNKNYTHAPITMPVELSTHGIYKYVSQNPAKVFEVEDQLKTLMHSVWRVKCYDKESINYSLLRELQNRPDPSINIPYRSIKFNKSTSWLDPEAFLYLYYSLLPAIDYNITPDNFESYLNIFQNIVMAKNSSLRYEHKKEFEAIYKAAKSAEEKEQLVKDYDQKISAFKNDYTFKIINYLNYIYVNCPDQRGQVISTILFNHNSTSILNELLSFSRDEFVKQVDRDQTGLIVNVYQYNYTKQIKLADYIDNFITIMVNTLLGTYEYHFEFTKDNYPILSLFFNQDYILERFIEHMSNASPIVAKFYRMFILEHFPGVSLDEPPPSTDPLKEIRLNFNKLSEKNYPMIADTLSSYSPDDIVRVFISTAQGTIDNYSIHECILRYVLSRCDATQRTHLINNLLATPFDKLETYAFYFCYLNDTGFYQNCSDKPGMLCECRRFIDYANMSTKRFIRLQFSFIDLENVSSYVRFNLEDLSEMI